MSQCLMVVFTGILAAAAIAQFFVSKWQWDAMGGQLGEMKAMSEQTNCLIEQAKKNAEAAKQSADATLLKRRPS
jgi:hypothetical protein